MLRVGVTIKQIENKHLQNWLIFRVWIICGGNAPHGYGPILRDTVTARVYIDKLFFNCLFIYSDYQRRLLSFLRDGLQYCFCLVADSYFI